ncbi:heavy metal-associated domain-containing protein, partial [Acinetobacter baumannii]
ARVEKALKKVDGVQEATVNLATEQAWVQADNSVNVEDLIRAVKKAGYDAKASEKNQDVQLDKKASELDQLKKDLI